MMINAVWIMHTQSVVTERCTITHSSKWGQLSSTDFSLSSCQQHWKTTDTKARQCTWSCNATTNTFSPWEKKKLSWVTGSTNKLESDKGTEKEGKRHRRRAAFETRESDGPSSGSFPCWWLWCLPGLKEGHFMGSAPLRLSNLLSFFLYLAFLMISLSAALSGCLYVHKITRVYLSMSVSVLKRSEIERPAFLQIFQKCASFPRVSACVRVCAWMFHIPALGHHKGGWLEAVGEHR